MRDVIRDTERGMMRAGTFLLIVQATLVPAGLAAQGVHLDVVPVTGWHAPREALGAAAIAGPAWYARFDRPDASAAIGLSAEVARPGHWLAARLTALYTMPAAMDATFDCRPGLACPSVLLESAARVSTAGVLADLVVDLWDTGPVRPWIAAGGAIRRYDLSWNAPAVLLESGSHVETVPGLHFAVGTDVRIGPGALRAGIGGIWSAEGDRIQPAPHSSVPAPSIPGRTAQRDLLLSLGWRITAF